MQMHDQTFAAQLTEWRRYLHAHPELSFEEAETARFIAARLTEMGIPFESGIGGHGIVATIARPGSNRSVGLRADMDALPIEEANDVAYRSTKPGVMHACGHDGHTTALLGAAKLLADDPDWSGTVHLIFQPAEEKGGGAKAMLADGLLERFSMDRVFALHNWPGLPAGEIAVHSGPVFAAGGPFYITLHGVAGHAAAPHLTKDTIVAAGHLLVALQTVVSRNVNPLNPAVVTVGKISGGTVTNQIPERVEIAGTIRTYDLTVRREIADAIHRVSDGIAATYGIRAEVNVSPGGQVSINAPGETEIAASAAAAIGAVVHRDIPPTMGGDDMGYILAKRPGAYIWIGNGPALRDGELHNPRYDFNDEILPTATHWFAEVAKRSLDAEGLGPTSYPRPSSDDRLVLEQQTPLGCQED